ncbi:unnamed protein product [Onchocerca flexuosa]|uniref:Uncharacterized protein n=1 Tax=Onchocerca flexuosa TaxID=387005 RepID=A0A183HMJ9_9BILA|nr:unnamed protein product [Onchocerca flexuosa]
MSWKSKIQRVHVTKIRGVKNSLNFFFSFFWIFLNLSAII